MKRFLGIILVSMIVVSSFVGVFSIMPVNVSAAGPTPVNGYITTNTTWQQVNSPYIVMGDVTVDNDTLLIIEPGVTVKFDGLYSLIVNGTLNATGTAGQPILFTSNQSSPSNGDWNRVRLHGKNNTMDYCEIEYGNYPLYIMGANTNNKIVNCTIHNSQGDGMYLKETTNNTIDNAEVYFCKSNGITLLMSENNIINNSLVKQNKAFGIYLRSSKNNTIANTNVTNNTGGGIELGLTSNNIKLKNVTVFENQDNGIDLDGNDNNKIMDSQIIGNDGNGIDLGGKSEYNWIENCIIKNNTGSGIDLKSSMFADIINCNITQNQGEAGIYSGSSVSYVNITGSKIWNNLEDGIEIYEAKNVNITNSNISKNIFNGISFNGSEIQENNIIKNCVIMSNGNNGIYFYADSYSISNIRRNKIYLNNIYSNTENGIYLYAYMYYYIAAPDRVTFVQNNNIHNNIIYSNTKNGIYLQAFTDNSGRESCIQYNNIHNNTLYLNTQNGIYLKSYNDHDTWRSWIQYNNIYNNTAYSNNQNGIYLEAFTEYNTIYIQNNNIYRNTIYSNDQNGINIYANTIWESSEVDNNNIYNNIIYSNNKNGIFFHTNLKNERIYSQYNNIHANTVCFNNQNGIYFYYYSRYITEFDYNSIYNNTVYMNNQNGIYIYTKCEYRRSNIQYNNIYLNTIYSNAQNGLDILVKSNATSIHDAYYYSYLEYNKVYLNTIYSNNQSGIYLYGYTKNGFLYFQNNEIYSNTVYLHNNSCGIYTQTDNCDVIWQSSNIYKNTLNSNLIGIEFQGVNSHIVYINNITNSTNDGVLLNSSSSNTFGYNKIQNNNWCGINLTSNSNSNKIQNNNISLNNQTGIYITGNSDSNKITRNDIMNNLVTGLNITGAMDNYIHHNNFKNNTQNGYDSTTQLNDWDDGSEGNWWDDYTGFDANNDGIGDIPYDVPGGGSKDWYPIIKPANITAPHIENTTPPDGAVNVSVTPQISITFSNKMNRTATESALSMSGGLLLTNFKWFNGDLTVTFVPSASLSSSTKYSVTVSIAAKDIFENHLENNYQFSFTTKDIIPPTITLTSPVHNSVNIALNADIVVTFSESMNISTVTFSCSPDVIGWGPPIWSAKNTVVTFTHTTNFGSLTPYTFRITGGKDLGGNDLVSGSKPNPWTFTTIDVVGPEITTTTPADGAKGVLLNTNVVVTFSEQMNTTSVKYTCKPDPGGWGTTWTNSDKTVTYSHNPFTTSTIYTFHITQGNDTADNPLNPSLPNPWSFTTKDTIPPKISVTSPANGSVNIPITAKIIVTFNEEMDNTTVGYVCNPNPGEWSVIWTGGNTVATYSHNSFIENTKYTFQITSGKDVSANDLVAGSVPNPWSFTTIDFTPPKISATMPVNDSIDITLNANVVVTFSEAMDTNSIAFTCTPNPSGWAAVWSGGDSIVTYTHDLFTSFTNYTFHITAAKDLGGNDLIAGTIPNPWPFKTKDALSPTITTTLPVNGSANVAITSNIVVTFSEKMDTQTVNFICSPNPAGWSEIWSAGDTVVTYMHNPFERYETYTFQITSGLDLGGNNIVAGDIPNPWTFTTIDNLPPIIQSEPIETATEDVEYIYDIEAFDFNNDILTYQLSSYPTGMTINSSSGLISWVPTNDQVGDHPVIALVADGNGGIDMQNYILTVLNANDAPIITSTPTLTATEDTKYNYDVEAYDIDVGDELNCSLIICPDDMVIDVDSGMISWIPTNEQVGKNYVTVKVSDKYDGVATQAFTIIVTNVNDPPTITSTAITTAIEDSTYMYDVQAVDIDPTKDVLTFSLNKFPTDMVIDPAAGEITWNPTNDQVGLNNVAVVVSDGNGGSDTQSFSIDVTNMNDPPTITSNPVKTAVEDQQYIYDVEAEDIDIGDMLSYGLDSSPGGMTIDTNSGIITWKPTNEDVGVIPISVKVVDSGSARATQAFTITVENVNDPPSITSLPVINAKIDTGYLYDVEASDIDLTDDVMSFSITTYPEGMTIDPATGVITWTPSVDQQGSNNVVVVVSDGNGGTHRQAFTITVEPMEAGGKGGGKDEGVSEAAAYSILLLIIIIIMVTLLFLFVLRPKGFKLGKTRAAEEETKPEREGEPPVPKRPQMPTAQETPRLEKAPESVPPPPVPAPLPVMPKLKPKAQAPPPKLKPKPEPTVPRLKPKPEPPAPKIKPKLESTMPKIKPKSEATVPKVKSHNKVLIRR